MDVDFVKTSIGSYKTRLKDREDDAIAAIRDGSYWTAEIALSDCAGLKAVIDELEFQLEVMEADNA